MPGGRQIPECTQKHHRMGEELFSTLYNATLLKLHLTTCFTLLQCSENIQQISKFLSQNILLGPSCVSKHILKLIQISVTKMQLYIIMYRCSQKPQTCLMLSTQIHYQEFCGVAYCQIESRFE
jgi:hypothetical protein